MNIELLMKIKKDLCLKSHSTPYKWTNGLNGVPKTAAKKLEELTGVDRRKFCWPDDFGDPWPEVEAVYKNK